MRYLGLTSRTELAPLLRAVGRGLCRQHFLMSLCFCGNAGVEGYN